MPTISRFYGITITMYYDDHGVPHFHARYGGDVASIAIGTLEVLHGSLPTRALRLARAWARKHHEELLDDWLRARSNIPLAPIEPLR